MNVTPAKLLIAISMCQMFLSAVICFSEFLLLYAADRSPPHATLAFLGTIYEINPPPEGNAFIMVVGGVMSLVSLASSLFTEKLVAADAAKEQRAEEEHTNLLSEKEAILEELFEEEDAHRKTVEMTLANMAIIALRLRDPAYIPLTNVNTENLRRDHVSEIVVALKRTDDENFRFSENVILAYVKKNPSAFADVVQQNETAEFRAACPELFALCEPYFSYELN